MRGVTLPEMLVVLALMALTAAVAIPPVVRALDRAATEEGAWRYAAMFETTRALAIARARQARIELDTARGTAVIAVHDTGARWDTVDARPLGRARVSASQAISTFSPLGFGFGLSNATIIFVRGTASDTLTVSRTGRLKRS
jgi:prepilin-type N-terminal cleavage/methylation domain-containing protein